MQVIVRLKTKHKQTECVLIPRFINDKVQGVSGEKVNILGGGNVEYFE